ncbi:importin-beta N-terminal domain-containing protein [Babesia caballi]|uniref:Importin-beta N-terminal domain-containing protein n=1 Tax=Babesia caballi TaxID=5871 RepID=A0AAV4LQ01_BABCB|nr:importin-beta N-terminal domain-containing protein [Babesia caballi]
MSADNSLSLEALHGALEGSLSPDHKVRKQSEDYLLKITTIKGAIPLLFSFISADRVDSAIRLAGAVKLKNLVLSQWRKTDGLCAEDRAALWGNIYDAVLVVGPGNDAIRRQCFETLRHIVFNASRGDVSPIVQRIKTDIEQRSNGDTLLCALKVLRKLMYRYEYHSSSLTEEVNALVDTFFGQLLKVAQDASKAGMDSPDAATCIHHVLKIYFSMGLLTTPTTKTVENTLQAWMALVQFVLDNPVPWNKLYTPGEHTMLPYAELSDEEEARLRMMPRFKCFKWALQILTKYMSKQVPRKTEEEDGKKHYVRYIKDGYAVEFAKKLVILMQAETTGNAVFTNYLHHKMWTYLKYALAFPQVYTASIQPCASVIVQMLFRTFACGVNDEQRYVEDPESYMQSCPEITFQLQSLRGTAADFIKDACKIRKADFAPIVIAAAKQVFGDRGNSVPEVYGVMCLIGHTARGVLQNSKRTKGKSSAKITDVPDEQLLDGEALVAAYVVPALASSDKWLRMRSAWLCGRIVMSTRAWRDSQTLLKLYSMLLEMIGDQEILVSVMATGAVLGFFHSSDETLQSTIVKYLPHLLQSLFKLMERIELETVISTLDEIVAKYSVEVLPFGAQIAENVCNALWNSLSANGTADSNGDDNSDEQVLARWSMIQTLTSIVKLVASTDAKDMTARDCEMFAKIVQKTATLISTLYENLDLDRLMEFVDDLALMLGYLAKITHKIVGFAGEEKTATMGVRFADMWKLLELFLRAIANYHAIDEDEGEENPMVIVDLSVVRDPVRSLLAYAPSGFTFEVAVQLYTLCQRASSGDDTQQAERLLADMFEVSINSRACDRILEVAAKELAQTVVADYTAITETPMYFKSRIRYIAVLLTYSCGENPPLKSITNLETLIRVLMLVSPGGRSKYMRKLYLLCFSSLMQVGVLSCEGESIASAIDELLLDESGVMEEGGMGYEVDGSGDDDDDDDEDEYDYASDSDDYDTDDDYYDESYDDEDFDDGCSPLDGANVLQMSQRVLAGKPAL